MVDDETRVLEEEIVPRKYIMRSTLYKKIERSLDEKRKKKERQTQKAMFKVVQGGKE